MGDLSHGNSDGNDLVRQLAPGAADYGSLMAKVAINFVPVVGGALSAFLDALPAQRMDRIARCMAHFAQRVTSLEARLEERAAEARHGAAPEWSQLFLNGIRASADATTEERLQRIAALLAKGLTEDEAGALQSARLLRHLNTVDDQEILVLSTLAETDGVCVKTPRTLPDVAAPTLVTEEQPSIPDLPDSLQRYDTSELLLMLQSLTSAGLVDAGSTTVLLGGIAVKAFAITAIGLHLLKTTATADTSATPT